ncbi:DUF2207 domain-containing protein [Microbacterium sp. A82]|uniref:DUF2207 domain-containing protein n=1 Tax=Microbacterium sp. A82 TaxID=3450452 RepID=UPI003F3E9E17
MTPSRLPRILALLAAAVGAVLFGSAPATAADAASTNVNDFDFSSWDSTFEISLDDEGRAKMHVEETRVAEFPDFDQNRGIVAGYPTSFEGASIDTRILSVRDENGDDVPYETDDDDGFLYVLTGNDDYVHGPTTYVIEYEMRDVILAATESGLDEFYWNLLPLDSTQDIASFHAEIRFDDQLAEHLTGSASSCYQGEQDSTATCDITIDGATFSVAARDVPAGEGLTVAIGLDSGTVTQPSARQPNAATDVLPYAVGGGALLLSLGGWFATRSMIRSRRRGTGIIVAQYDVPGSMPPLLASAIVPKAKDALSAQIIHLAVQGLLRVEELPEEGQKKRRPRLRRLEAPIPDPLDERSLKALFGSTELGVVMKMPKNSSSFAARIQKLLAAAPKEADKRGFTTKARSTLARIIQALALVVFAGMVLLLGWGMFTGRASAGPVFFVTLLCGIAVLISSVVAFKKHTVLTREGALQLEYLEGVREFIRVAEADRLQMLQSYTGAERRSDGSIDVIHVYEKLLPYAILFGQEREWGKVLEVAYGAAQQDPEWVNGSHYGLVTRMLIFSSVTQTSSTYTAPSSGSSSAGGSMGGGFSGGGGGGGFSGGR